MFSFFFIRSTLVSLFFDVIIVAENGRKCVVFVVSINSICHIENFVDESKNTAFK